MESQAYERVAEKWNSEVHYEEEKQRIQSNLELLRKELNPAQRKLLLRIIDDKDLITEMTACDQYTRGFRTGIKIIVESLCYEG